MDKVKVFESEEARIHWLQVYQSGDPNMPYKAVIRDPLNSIASIKKGANQLMKTPATEHSSTHAILPSTTSLYCGAQVEARENKGEWRAGTVVKSFKKGVKTIYKVKFALVVGEKVEVNKGGGSYHSAKIVRENPPGDNGVTVDVLYDNDEVEQFVPYERIRERPTHDVKEDHIRLLPLRDDLFGPEIHTFWVYVKDGTTSETIHHEEQFSYGCGGGHQPAYDEINHTTRYDRKGPLELQRPGGNTNTQVKVWEAKYLTAVKNFNNSTTFHKSVPDWRDFVDENMEACEDPVKSKNIGESFVKKHSSYA